eukprot:6480129-Amphidinium_carterae.2
MPGEFEAHLLTRAGGNEDIALLHRVIQGSLPRFGMAITSIGTTATTTTRTGFSKPSTLSCHL